MASISPNAAPLLVPLASTTVSVSRDSSPLSDVESSSPAASSPKPLRSPSLALSSPSPSLPPGADSQDELAGLSDLDTPATAAKRGGADKYGFNPSALPTAQCEWGDCDAEFYELEPFIEHLHNTHAYPINPGDIGTKKALIYMCDWQGCPRRGKNQTSKFALLGHLRSHTGEKPFNCPRPECDKSFTRTDALQKHMRIQHQEVIVPARRPPSKKRKTAARGGSVDSILDGPKGEDDDASTIAGGDDDPNADLGWADEELELFEKHPDLGRGFVAYVFAKAKWAYLLGEHEGLLGELEALGTREAELGAECEELLKRIMRKEVGQDDRDPNNPKMLETFLTAYTHKPAEMPLDWTGEPK